MAVADGGRPKELTWAQKLQTADDGNKLTSDFSRPEFYRVKSASKTGKSFAQTGRKVPACSRPEPVRQPLEAQPGDDQLLYLAIYRDKVTQHQAQLAKSQEKPRSNLARHERAALHLDDSTEELQGNSSPSTAQRPRRDRSQAETGAAAAGCRPLTVHEKADEASTHVASVRVQRSGVAAEHLQARHLGQLFDQWREECADDYDSLVSATSGSFVHKPTGTALTAAGTLASRGPRGNPRGTNSSSAAAAMQRAGSYVSTHAGHPGSEQPGAEGQKMHKLFNVITNPKARHDSFVDRGATEARQLPSSIEGFPVLELSRLYQGPWRLRT